MVCRLALTLRIVGKYLVFIALSAGWTCKLSAPNAFLDAVADINEFLKTMNVRSGGELWSGVVAGSLPGGVTEVQIKFDDGDFKKATIDSNRWKVFIPVGAEAAAGKKRWQVGSQHFIYLKARGVNGNLTPIGNGPISFTRQLNKDVNSDGYADVVVSAWQNTGFSAAGGQSAGSAGKGAVYIFYGSAAGVALHPENGINTYYCSGPPDCTVIGNPDDKPTGLFGKVAFAGDTNGDGYGDIIVGASGNDGTSAAGGQSLGAITKGAAYIFYGSAAGITLHPENGINAYYCSGPPDCTVIGNPDDKASASFGGSVAFAGDTNGDGFSDVIVGAFGNDGTSAAGGQLPGAGSKGAAYIFYGSAAGITLHPENGINTYYCSGPPDCTVIGNPDDKGSASFGGSVAFAGDTNGDGFSDIIVAAGGNSGLSAAGGQSAGSANRGAAYIFYGSAAGITLHPENGINTYYCSGPPDCTVIGNPDNPATGAFGGSVAFAGDTNGDGFSDVIVGASGNNGSFAAGGQSPGSANRGAAYIFYGSAAGITLHPENGINTYYCSGPPDCTVIGNPDNPTTGAFAKVAFAGDANGDGYGDIIVGAPGNDGSSAAGGQSGGAGTKGAAYIFYGSAAGITLHPENGTNTYYCSGPPDCTVLSNPDNQPNGSFGGSVAVAGDINGDGFSDIIVGANKNNGTSAAGGQLPGALNKGAAYIFYGSATGMKLHPESGTNTYYCSGPPDCTVLGNPDNQASGGFGIIVTFAPDAPREEVLPVFAAPLRRQGPSSLGIPIGEVLTLAPRREESADSEASA